MANPDDYSSPRTFQIAVLPGDGIGSEVMESAISVFDAVQLHLKGVNFILETLSAGAGAFLTQGDPLPQKTLDACVSADAILLGAMGLPSVRWPDGKEMTPQIDLREKLDLYSGVRPVRLFHVHDTPLKKISIDDIDFVIVRENTEGLFASRHAAAHPESGEVCDTLRITKSGAERVCRAAFRLALTRRHHVTLVDKANVLPSMVFLRSIFDAVAQEFPAVHTDHVYVDAAALYLVQRPQQFDVIVTENIFGDILSDLAAGLVGGMGMAPSADIGDQHAVFQPCHGTAPDIAGRGIANPVAMILSTAMMLNWLHHPETVRGARMIENAVQTVLADPRNRTADLGGSLSTRQMTDLVVNAVGL